MIRTYWKLTWLMFLTVLLGGTRPACAGDADLQLPAALVSHMEHRQVHAVLRLRWPAVCDLPFVRRALAAAPGDLLDSTPALGPVLRLHRELGPLAAEVQDAWLGMGSFADSGAGLAWVRTDLEPAAVRATLEAAKWIAVPGRPRAYAAPLDAKLDADYLAARADPESHPAEDWDTALVRLCRRKTRLTVGDGGWVAVAPPMSSSPSAGHLRRPRGHDGAPLVAFPFTGLLEMGPDEVAVLALDVPGNEARPAAPPPSPAPLTRRGIEHRLAELGKLEEAAISRRLGDFLVEVSEVDGALAIDLTSHRPGGGDMAVTARMTQLVFGFASLGVLYDSPDLARDLARPQLTDEGNQMRASVLLGLGSLDDAVAAEISRRAELRELRQHLRELAAGRR